VAIGNAVRALAGRVVQAVGVRRAGSTEHPLTRGTADGPVGVVLALISNRRALVAGSSVGRGHGSDESGQGSNGNGGELHFECC